MSSRLGMRQLQEAVEEIAGVVRPRPGFGVVLDGAPRNVLEDQPLDRAVVEVEVGELGVAEVGLPTDRLVAIDRPIPARPEHREPVVLGGDVDPPRAQVLDRMVRAAVAERELEGLEADRATEQLVAEADSDHGRLADHTADVLDHVVQGPRVAGAVGEEDQVRVTREDLVRRAVARQERHTATPFPELPDDRELDPGIDPDNVRAVSLELDRHVRGHRPSEVGSIHGGLGVNAPFGLGLGELHREDPTAHGAAVAAVADQRASVDPADRRDATVPEPVEPAALCGGRVLAVLSFPHDHTAGVDAVGLHRAGRDAVVTDQRVGEGDDLPRVARIGDRLLVSRHRGVEDDFARHLAVRAEQLAVEAGAILEENEPSHPTGSGFGAYSRISFWTRLNSSVPARPRSSKSAVSTLVRTAPACSILWSPTRLFSSVRDP